MEKMTHKLVVLQWSKKFQVLEKKIFQKILSAYLYRQDLQKGARKFFKNKWVSRYLTFGDFLVPKNCSSTINKT